MSGIDVAEGFLPATSPGCFALAVPNLHYDSYENYLFALARALREEYRAIASPLTGWLRPSRPRSAAAPRPAPRPGGSRQAGGRHHGPSGPSRTLVVPDGQRRAAPVPVIAPAGGAAAAVLRRPRRGPAGAVPQARPSPARVRVPGSQRGYRVTARRAAGQSHR